MRLFLIALLLLVASAQAECPISVNCSLDGGMMLQEQCYFNGSHKTCKYSHDHWGPNGKEHHYVMVACD